MPPYCIQMSKTLPRRMFFEASLGKTLDVNVLYPRPNQGLQKCLKRNPKILNEQLHKKKSKLFSSFLLSGANSACLNVLQMCLKRNPEILNEQLHKKNTKLFSSFLLNGANSGCLNFLQMCLKRNQKILNDEQLHRKKKYEAILILPVEWSK
ncbi:unnamed protein product [Larinioides sclopetarius]|uniref:Uncharacterized protein n=1 Tax=Larinioides sclopetarius TaxID=280406 RepID=A0AAV2ASD9_9ARAC